MKSFNTYHKTLEEALVTFGGKAYPKSDQAVILAGGAGSGKGFILKKLLGIQGRVFDVDELKSAMLKQDKFKEDFKKEIQKYVDDGKLEKMPDLDDEYSMKNSLIVRALHAVAEKHNIPDKVIKTFFRGIQGLKNLPNAIFDVTLKDVKKLQKLSALLIENGYKKENIHIVWIVNNVRIAWKQNVERKRVVPRDIFISTHEGAAQTMDSLISDSNELRRYMDGDFWIVPNRADVNSKFEKGTKKGSGYFVFADTFKIKPAGKPVNMDMMTKKLQSKIPSLFQNIKDYTPSGKFGTKRK